MTDARTTSPELTVAGDISESHEQIGAVGGAGMEKACGEFAAESAMPTVTNEQQTNDVVSGIDKLLQQQRRLARC